MSGAPLSRRSRKQSCVSLSTAEAKYVAMASAAQEATWMRPERCPPQANKTNCYLRGQPISYCCSPEPPVSQQNIDIWYSIREKVLDDTIELRYCPTDKMLVDVLSKK